MTVPCKKQQLSKQTLKTLEKTGYFRLKEKHGSKRKTKAVGEVYTASPTLSPLSDVIDGNGFKKDIMAHRWKAGCQEKLETVREIERKAQAIAPLVNKQGYSYITPNTDIKSIGRK